MLLAKLLAVGAPVPAVTGEVAAVGHVLYSGKQVERPPTRTPVAGRPVVLTTTPLIAPTPVVSCATADVAARLKTVAPITVTAGERRADNSLRHLTDIT